MMRSDRYAIRLWTALILVLQLAACGFHLRGAMPLPEVMGKTHIVGGNGSELYYELENALYSAGGEVVDKAESATGILTLHSQKQDRRVLSVDSRGRAAEYELSLKVVFSLKSVSGEALAEREQVTVVRDYRFDPDSVLAKGDEEAALRREMERLAVEQMMRRLQTLSRAPSSGQAK